MREVPPVVEKMAEEIQFMKNRLSRLENDYRSALSDLGIPYDFEISKWEVVWSRDQPFMVYRTPGVLKIFKVKVEDDFFITAPIKGSDGGETYEKVRKTLCEKYDFDGQACSQIRALYRELFKIEF